jgi:magnesium transporter
MDAIEDEIDELQDDVIRNATPATLERLFALKRELIGLRRATSPAREIFNQLTNRDLPLVSDDHIVYFRDVYDHLIRVTDELDNDRDLVAGTLDVYLSTINNNLSIIMKRLTGVTVILAGIGAFAGIFGMSEAGAAFQGNEAAGFWLVTGVVFAAAIGLASILRRIGWI